MSTTSSSAPASCPNGSCTPNCPPRGCRFIWPAAPRSLRSWTPNAPSPKAPGWPRVSEPTEAVGDDWSWLVLSDAIIDGTRRFDAFRRRLEIARSTLSARLSSLCDDGLMVQQDRDYLLTDAGADVFACVRTAMAWGTAGIPTETTSRRASSTSTAPTRFAANYVAQHTMACWMRTPWRSTGGPRTRV